MFRDLMDEKRAEKQVAAVMQKILDQQDSHGRKFFYAISRLDCISCTIQFGIQNVHACLLKTSDLWMMQEMRHVIISVNVSRSFPAGRLVGS